MYKLVTLFVILKLTTVLTCSTQSAPSCEEKKYKNYEERNALIRNLSSSIKMNRISLIGTHQSFSYLSGNSKTKTQELDILFQLRHGIRVLDMIVQVQDNSFAIYSGSLYLPHIFDDTLKKVSKFLKFNPREFVILILNTMTNQAEDTNCRVIDWYIQQNEAIGWRLIKDWSFDDPLGIYRGKILLATFGASFQNCAVNFGTECKFENSTASSVAEKWNKIVNFQEKCYLENRNCFVYQLSIDTKKGLRADTKYGGYFVDNQCVEPINSKMANFFYPTKRGMFIVLADYITQELIDRVNNGNNRTLETIYYWETVKKKFLYAPKKL